MKFIKLLDDKFEEYILITSLAFTSTLIFVQVIMRYCFQSSLSWSEELARYLFLWQIWLGASYAVKESRHIRVEVVVGLLPKKARKAAEVIVLLIWIGFSIWLTSKSGMLTNKIFALNQLSPAMRMPMGLAYASVPVGCGLMTIRLIQKLFKEFKTVDVKEGK